MTFVFPMAGKGQRFVDAGYDIPKFLIEVNGKSLLQYSIESLPLEIADKIIFVALKEHMDKFPLDTLIRQILGSVNYEIIVLDEVTRGQAETILKAKESINFLKDLVVYNIDTYFKSEKLKSLLLSPKKYDGIIGSFIDTNPKWSFAQLDNNNEFVIRTTEKDPISHHALTGMYHFTRASDFFEVAEMYISNNILVKNEFYIAPMYTDLIANGKKYILDSVDELIPLGTPDDIAIFKQNILNG